MHPATRPSPANATIVAALVAVALLTTLLPAAAGFAAPPKWELVTHERGVKVYALKDPKRPVPLLRARATINAGLYHLLAILGDVDRAKEWNPAVKRSKSITRQSDVAVTFYVRIGAPWPVSDRDGVLTTGVKRLREGEQIKAWFRDVKVASMPPKSGLVRFPRLRGHYLLTRLGPKKTRVVYLLDADAGGWLPKWALTYALRSMPRDAVAGLRVQSRRTVGTYDAFIARHEPKPTAPPAKKPDAPAAKKPDAPAVKKPDAPAAK